MCRYLTVILPAVYGLVSDVDRCYIVVKCCHKTKWIIRKIRQNNIKQKVHPLFPHKTKETFRPNISQTPLARLNETRKSLIKRIIQEWNSPTQSYYTYTLKASLPFFQHKRKRWKSRQNLVKPFLNQLASCLEEAETKRRRRPRIIESSVSRPHRK